MASPNGKSIAPGPRAPQKKRGDAGASAAGHPLSGQGTPPPQTIVIFVRIWLAVVALQLIHQATDVAMGLVNLGPLRYAAQEMAEEQGVELTGASLTAAAVTSLGLAALTAVLVVVLLWLGIRAVAKAASWADSARRLLIIFGAYFALRAAMLVISVPSGSGPVEVYAVDGCLQILAGVAAAVSIYYGTREEARQWTAPPGQQGSSRRPGGDAKDGSPWNRPGGGPRRTGGPRNRG